MYTLEQNWRNGKYEYKVINGVDDIEQIHFERETIITCTYDGILKVYDLPTSKCKYTLPQTNGDIVWFDFSNNVLVTAHLDEEVMNVWDLSAGVMVRALNSPGLVATFCFTGDSLVSGEVGYA